MASHSHVPRQAVPEVPAEVVADGADEGAGPAGDGAPLAAVAGGVGALVGAVGNYFGRDLRDGLTREI